MTRYAMKTTAMIGNSVVTEPTWRTARRNHPDSWSSYWATVMKSAIDRTESLHFRKRRLSRVSCDCRERALLYEARWQAIRPQNSHRVMRTAHGFHRGGRERGFWNATRG